MPSSYIRLSQVDAVFLMHHSSDVQERMTWAGTPTFMRTEGLAHMPDVTKSAVKD
jgi:hypothetical protein